MPMMNYFRRPQLAGNNLPRPTYPTVRGAIRASPVDAEHSAPYFPNLTGEALLVRAEDGATTTITFTSDALATAISTLNTALAGKARAAAQDNVVHIQTLAQGGYIEVLGGTAAPILGFPTVGGIARAFGADLSSATEGRSGNPFGTALPSSGENLGLEVLRRAFGRLSANMDVLYADMNKPLGVLKKASSFTISADGKNIDLTGVPVVVGGLAKDSDFNTLAAYYRVVDAVTHLPAATRVISVVNGAQAGVRPAGGYADTASWEAADGGNVLGLNLTKTQATITSIDRGHIVTCADADFVTAKVRAGDLVTISEATNTAPWSNNGLRWAVEEVVDLHTLTLRPISPEEVAAVGGTPPDDNQPILELNSVISGDQVFGVLSVATGTVNNNVTLVVDPPISPTGSYEVWVSHPSSVREAEVGALSSADAALQEGFHAFLDAAPNGLLSLPTVSLNGSKIDTTAFWVRWHGRAMKVAAASTSRIGSDGYLYLNERTLTLGLGNPTNADLNGAANPEESSSGTYKQLIARVLADGTIFPCAKILETRSSVVTVGSGGQFSTLAQAVEYANDRAALAGEGATPLAYPHTEIVLLQSQVVAAGTSIPLSATGLVIRAAAKAISIQRASGAAGATFVVNRPATLRDVLVNCTYSPSPFDVRANGSLVLENCEVTGNCTIPGIEARHTSFYGTVSVDVVLHRKAVVLGCYFDKEVELRGSIQVSGSSFNKGVSLLDGGWDYMMPISLASNRIFGKVTIEAASSPVLFIGNTVVYNTTVLGDPAVFVKRGSPTIALNHVYASQMALQIGEKGVTSADRVKFLSNDVRFATNPVAPVDVTFELVDAVGDEVESGFPENSQMRFHVLAWGMFGFTQIYSSNTLMTGTGSVDRVLSCTLTGHLPGGYAKVMVIAEYVGLGMFLTPQPTPAVWSGGGYIPQEYTFGPGSVTLRIVPMDGVNIGNSNFTATGFADDVPAIFSDVSSYSHIIGNTLNAGSIGAPNTDGKRRYVYLGTGGGDHVLFGQNHLAGHGALTAESFTGEGASLASCLFMPDPSHTTTNYGGTIEE